MTYYFFSYDVRGAGHKVEQSLHRRLNDTTQQLERLHVNHSQELYKTCQHPPPLSYLSVARPLYGQKHTQMLQLTALMQ